MGSDHDSYSRSLRLYILFEDKRVVVDVKMCLVPIPEEERVCVYCEEPVAFMFTIEGMNISVDKASEPTEGYRDRVEALIKEVGGSGVCCVCKKPGCMASVINGMYIRCEDGGVIDWSRRSLD